LDKLNTQFSEHVQYCKVHVAGISMILARHNEMTPAGVTEL